MATEYDDTRDWAFFVRDSKTLTSANGFANRWSEQVLAALRAGGVFDNMVDGLAPPATDKLWLDKNTDPAVLKQWDSTGSSWVPMTYDRLFGQAALGVLAVTGGTANAIVVAQPNSVFQASRLYAMTPTSTNAAGAVTIQVAGVGIYPVKYSDGSNLMASEFSSGRQAILFFDGTKFTVVFSVGDLNASVSAAAASASAAAGSASAANTSASNAATSATNAANAAAAVITGATADDTIDDTDEVIYKTGTTVKRATFAAGLIASIFKTTRKIAAAAFQDDVTFYSAAGLTKGFKFLASGITAGQTRVITLPDRDFTPGITLMPVQSAGGTAVNFTGIPNGVRRVNVAFSGLSTNGANSLLIQLGGSAGTYETSGYLAYSSALPNAAAISGVGRTDGFPFFDNSASNSADATFTLTLVDPANNTWNMMGGGELSSSGAPASFVTCGGGKSIASVLDKLRVTTIGGVDTFDAGKVSVSYEY